MSFNSHTFEIPRSLLKKDSGFSLDYGHTLIKVVYIGESCDKNGEDDKVTLHMESFLPDHIDDALDLIKNQVSLKPGERYLTTGLSAAASQELIESKLNIKVSNVAELQVYAKALQFMKKNFKEEDFTLPSEPPHMEGIENYYAMVHNFQRNGGAIPVSWDETEPLSDAVMMLIIGTVAGLAKMNADGTFSLVSANYTAGPTLTGMGRLIAGAKTFEELMSLASAGDLSNIHTCFPDILKSYSDKSDGQDIPGKDAVLFPYAKANSKDHDEFKKEDLAIGVVRSVADHIVQLSLMACNLHKVKKMYVCGGMMESELVRTEFAKSWAIETQLGYNRPVEMSLLKNSGYLGAIGALLLEDTNDFDNFMESVMG